MPRLVVPRGGYEEVKDSSALLVDAAAPRKVFVDAAAPPRRAFCAACALLLAAALGGLVGYAAADGSLAALVKARCGARSTAPAAAPPASTRHWIFAELSAAEVRAAARAATARASADGGDVLDVMGASVDAMVPVIAEKMRAFGW